MAIFFFFSQILSHISSQITVIVVNFFLLMNFFKDKIFFKLCRLFIKK
jgi:hypothetical protein